MPIPIPRPEPADATRTVHASCVSVDGAGILIRGEPGAGKSTLALLLLDRAALTGRPAGLVGDDRIRLGRVDATLVACPHPALGEHVEVRGLGLLRAESPVGSTRLRLVVDLVATSPRLPDEPMATVTLLGCALPGVVLDGALLRSGLAARLVLDALGRCPGVTCGTHRPVLTFPPWKGP